MTILANVLLREVPAELLAGVGTGDYQVFGSIIRSTTSGRIVGHLQETSALSNLVAQGPLAPLSLVGDAVSAVQNEQIKAAIGVVQSLQVANLALGAAAIGVSVAGTGILMRKLSLVETKIDALQPALARLSADIRELRQERIAEELTRLSTLLAQLEECWNLSQPEIEWRAIAREAHFLADNFKRRALEVQREGNDPLAALPFLDAFALASMTRVSSRMASDDMLAAFEAANGSATELVEMGRGIQLAPLVLERALRSNEAMGTADWTAQIDEIEADLRPQIDLLRQREAAAASSVLTLDHLRSAGISGREWLEAARSEKQSPLLYLPLDSREAAAADFSSSR